MYFIIPHTYGGGRLLVTTACVESILGTYKCHSDPCLHTLFDSYLEV